MELLILGAGGHGRVVKEIAQATGKFKRIAFLDDSYTGSDPCIIGKLDEYLSFTSDFTHAFVAVGDPFLRGKWMEKLSDFDMPVLIHPEAYVSPSAVIAYGTVIMPKAVVHTNVRIGTGCIVSAGAIIDHDAVLGDRCHINAGAVVPSGSMVPDNTKVNYGCVFG